MKVQFKENLFLSRVFALSVLLLLISVSIYAKEAGSIKYSKQELSDASYVMQTASGPLGRALNLSDARDYRFLVSEFKRAGMTKKKFPQLFKSIEEAREEHKRQGVPLGVLDQNNNDFTYTPFIHNITGLSTSNGEDYHAGAELSVAGKPYSVAMTLSLHDSNNQPIGHPAKINSNTGDPYYTLHKSHNTHDSSVKALLLSFFTIGGEPYSPRASMIATEELPTLTNFDPSPPIPGEKIKVCVNRTPNSANQCKYGIALGTKTVDLNISGKVVYPEAIDLNSTSLKPEMLLTVFTATNMTRGGGCIASGPNALDFTNNSQMSEGNTTLTYAIDRADFITNTDCLHNGDELVYNSYFAVTGESGDPLSAQVTSSSYIPAASNVVIIPNITVVSGCLGAGSQVQMHDGSLTKIETLVNGGEKILSGNGSVKTSQGLITGTEEKPMIYIEDEEGRSLLLSQTHPVITYDKGVKLALELKVGDIIVRKEGKSTLKKVLHKAYKGKVYNIALGGPKEDISKDNTSFFANGFLVGDYTMQNYYAKIYNNRSDKVLQRLPKKWHTDFMNTDQYKQGRR